MYIDLICFIDFEASVIANCAASSQLFVEFDISSMTLMIAIKFIVF
jgi:hypothetical protein